jgi:uncharacterized membrane protein
MDLAHLSMLLHFLGFGLLFSTLVAGWMLHGQYKKATDYSTKAIILRLLRPIGLLSPFGILLMVLTGIGNMHVRGLGLFTESWLSAKIVVFIIASINGLVFGARAGKRAKLISQLADGSAPQGTDAAINALDKQMRLFYLIQSVLLLIILILSIVKPGRYGMPF